MRTSRPIGIDLGTTNSCVGFLNDLQSDVVLAETDGEKTTPSCVWYDEARNEVIVGPEAFQQRASYPQPVVSVKRKMGKLIPIPLGKANRIPNNLPAAVQRALTESREQRLDRYLARLEASNADDLKRMQDKIRQNPPAPWVLDQKARLKLFLEDNRDRNLRTQIAADPPLLWLPEEVSALILFEERRQITGMLEKLYPGGTHVVDRAVITIPAYFGAEQTEATKEAGIMAGLQVLGLLQEPSAAAVYYCWKHSLTDGLFMVVDLGGGTFDVSILRMQAGWPRVLGISGDHMLGGDDFDRELAQEIGAALAKDRRYDFNLDPRDPKDCSILESLVFMAERTKKDLSTKPTCSLDTSVTDRQGNNVAVKMTISRSRFEELISPLIRKCIPKCWEALAKANERGNVTLGEVDQIFLVGGATRVPAVQEMVRERFCGSATYTPSEIAEHLGDIEGDDPSHTAKLREIARKMMENPKKARCSKAMIDDPDFCVALGAAIDASRRGVETRDAATQVGVVFTSERSTGEPTTTIAGHLIGCDIRGVMTAQLTNSVLRLDEETSIEPAGSFRFPDVPLQPGSENRFELRVLSADGDEVLVSGLTIAHVGSGLVRRVGPDIPAAVVSRPYSLDVMRSGVVTRKILVASGEKLPVYQTHDLAVPDPNSGVIYFRVYQGGRLLKCIEAFLSPSVPPGTAVTFTFSIKEDHSMHATYRFQGEQEDHPVNIEPPDSLKPTEAEVSRIKEQLEEESEYLTGTAGNTFRIRSEKLTESMRKAAETGDDAKLIDRYEQLQALHEEMLRAKQQLTPPWVECEKLHGSCLSILKALKEEVPQTPFDEHLKGLNDTYSAAKKAYEAKNQAQYTTHVDKLGDTRDSLLKEYHQQSGSKETDLERAARMIKAALEEVKKQLQKADHSSFEIEDSANKERDPEKRSRLLNHVEQCRACAANLQRCQTVLAEVNNTYTADPKGAIDKCLSLNPVIHNAIVVLRQKEYVLEGKEMPAGEIPVPVDLSSAQKKAGV